MTISKLGVMNIEIADKEELERFVSLLYVVYLLVELSATAPSRYHVYLCLLPQAAC